IFKAVVRYPGTEEERAILRAHDHGQPSANIATLEPFDRGTLDACRTEVDAVKVEDSVLDYVGRIAAESRRSRDLILRASPRAAERGLRRPRARGARVGDHARGQRLPRDARAGNAVCRAYRRAAALDRGGESGPAPPSEPAAAPRARDAAGHGAAVLRR